MTLSLCGAVRIAPLAPAARASSPAKPSLLHARLTQSGAWLELRAVTSTPVRAWLGNRRATLCARLTPGSAAQVELCIGARRDLRLDTLDASGHARTTRPLSGTVATRGKRTVVVGFTMDAVGARAGPLAWSLRLRWTGSPCSTHKPCASRLPASGSYSTTLVAPGPIGCVPAGDSLRFGVPEPTDEVALTFDDGPGPWTPPILTALEQARASATFYIVGEHVPGREPLLRRMLRDGDALGNHSYSHPVLARDGAFAHGQIAETSALIWKATGYHPCLFRAPYGATSPSLIADARSQGLITTEWNVDPRDWSQPGVDAIVSTTLRQTRPGSIILMHDGGGVRSQTLEALPHVIAALRGRGLRLVTVPELLGLQQRYATPPAVAQPL